MTRRLPRRTGSLGFVRRRVSREEKLGIVAECQQPEVCLTTVARRNRVALDRLRRWVAGAGRRTVCGGLKLCHVYKSQLKHVVDQGERDQESVLKKLDALRKGSPKTNHT